MVIVQSQFGADRGSVIFEPQLDYEQFDVIQAYKSIGPVFIRFFNTGEYECIGPTPCMTR